MLAIIAAAGARLDAGAVGLALARYWSGAGDEVLFVDADTTGSRLAERLGEAVRAEYSPTVRGLPSLIVAREPFTPRLLARHCYSLDAPGGSLWGLFAPSHPTGGEHAAGWLADHRDDLAAVDRERRVIVSASLDAGEGPVTPLLLAAPVLIVLAPLESVEQCKLLWERCRYAGLMGFARKQRLVVVEGSSRLGDDQVQAETGMLLAGRLPVIDDDRVLRQQGGRRGRAFAAALGEIARRVSALLSLDDAERANGRADPALLEPEESPRDGAGRSTVASFSASPRASEGAVGRAVQDRRAEGS